MNDLQPVALTENQISRKALAHILPIAVFMGFLLVIPILEFFGFLCFLKVLVVIWRCFRFLRFFHGFWKSFGGFLSNLGFFLKEGCPSG